MAIAYIPRLRFLNGANGVVRKRNPNQPIGIKTGVPSLKQLCLRVLLKGNVSADVKSKISKMAFLLIGEDGKWVEDQRVSAKELIPNLFFELTLPVTLVLILPAHQA